MAKKSDNGSKPEVTETAAPEEGRKKKTECPVTRQQFTEKAPAVKVTIGDRSFTLNAREFSTGSLGYNLSDKIEVMVDGKAVKFQVGLNLIAVGSKELPK